MSEEQSQNKIFTIEEINALIPELETKVQKIQKDRNTYLQAHDTLLTHEIVLEAEGDEEKDLGDSERLEEDVHALEAVLYELSETIETLCQQGFIVRNIDQGLIDFNGELNGQPVFYSWKIGEERIEFYRDPNEPKERKPLGE